MRPNEFTNATEAKVLNLSLPLNPFGRENKIKMKIKSKRADK